MTYIDKVICGEKAFKDFAKRIRPGEKLQMNGTIGLKNARNHLTGSTLSMKVVMI